MKNERNNDNPDHRTGTAGRNRKRIERNPGSVRRNARIPADDGGNVDDVDATAGTGNRKLDSVPIGNPGTNEPLAIPGDDNGGNSRGNRRTGRTGRTGRNRNNAAGTGTDGIGTGTEKGTASDSEIPFRLNKPRGGRKSKASKEQEKLIACSLLAVGCTALFGTVAQFAGPHWRISSDESYTLGNSINDALSTLDESTYVQLFKFIEKYIPWISLAITAGSIVIPRYQQNQRIKTETRNANFGNVGRVNQRPRGFANGIDNDHSGDSEINGTGNQEPFARYK